jgi:hypothetical protein
MRESERRDFWCYVDEFHSFITPSMAEILTGARKYRVGLTLAHQELRQLRADDEVAGAVLANAYTRIAFRLGDSDARSLESGFTHFEAGDLQNLETGEAVCRIGRSDSDFNLTVSIPGPPSGSEYTRSEEIIAASRKAYGRLRSEIEAEARQRIQVEQETTPPKKAAVPPESHPVVSPPEVKTSPEKRIEPVAVEPIPAATIPRGHSDLGRGGAQHQAIQLKIKAAAAEAGFRVKDEKSVLDGAGSIDFVLERDGVAIACEINVTSTIDYEIGNVRKCLKAGFSQIAVICPRAYRLARLEEAVRGCFAAEEAAKVSFHSPDDFISSIQKPAAPVGATSSAAPAETTRRGYKVKRHFVEVSEEDAKAREQAAIKILAEKLRRPLK